MEYQKTTNLLNATSDNVRRFINKKWMEVRSDTPEKKYRPGKQIRFKISMLRSDLDDYIDAYITVEGTITFADPNNANYKKKLAFKNNVPFIFCIPKINNTFIENAEDLDIVMPMYNLIEYSNNNSNTSKNLWNYYRDEPNSGVGGKNNHVNYSIKDSKSLDCKISITGKLESINTGKENAKFFFPLKHLGNFWRTLDCEINLILTLSKNCELKSKATRDSDPDADPAVVAVNNSTNAAFKTADKKMYVKVVTLSTEDGNKLQ